MRLRSNRCLYSAPPAYSGHGRPHRHGQKFHVSTTLDKRLNQPQTWWAANQTVELDDPKLGKLRFSQWNNLHFANSAEHQMTLICVERLKVSSNGRSAKP